MRTKLSKILKYKDGSGEQRAIRIVDIESMERDAKCFTNKVGFDILEQLSNGPKQKNEFITYFRAVKPGTYYNMIKSLREQNFIKLERIEGVWYYTLNLKTLNEIESRFSNINEE